MKINKTDNNLTPLMLCALRGPIEDMQYTALMIATQSGYIEIIKCLLRDGADINIQNKDGYTALMIATQSGYIEIIKCLLMHGADINIQNKDGYTALMIATQSGNIEIIRCLLMHGADINIQNKYGQTALMTLENKNYITIIELFREYGANIQIELFQRGADIKKQHVVMIKLLREYETYKIQNSKENISTPAIQHVPGPSTSVNDENTLLLSFNNYWNKSTICELLLKAEKVVSQLNNDVLGLTPSLPANLGHGVTKDIVIYNLLQATFSVNDTEAPIKNIEDFMFFLINLLKNEESFLFDRSVCRLIESLLYAQKEHKFSYTVFLVFIECFTYRLNLGDYTEPALKMLILHPVYAVQTIMILNSLLDRITEENRSLCKDKTIEFFNIFLRDAYKKYRWLENYTDIMIATINTMTAKLDLKNEEVNIRFFYDAAERKELGSTWEMGEIYQLSTRIDPAFVKKIPFQYQVAYKKQLIITIQSTIEMLDSSSVKLDEFVMSLCNSLFAEALFSFFGDSATDVNSEISAYYQNIIIKIINLIFCKKNKEKLVIEICQERLLQIITMSKFATIKVSAARVLARMLSSNMNINNVLISLITAINHEKHGYSKLLLGEIAIGIACNARFSSSINKEIIKNLTYVLQTTGSKKIYKFFEKFPPSYSESIYINFSNFFYMLDNISRNFLDNADEESEIISKHSSEDTDEEAEDSPFLGRKNKSH